MRVFSKGLKTKALLLSMTAILSANTAFATITNLSEIKISSTPNNGYNVTLKTDTNTSYKTSIKDDTKLIVELKNTAQSENISTIYKEVPTINNVSIMDSGKDSLKIEITGNNVSNSIINIEPNNEGTPQTIFNKFNENSTTKTLFASILAIVAIILATKKRKKTYINANCPNSILPQRELELVQELNAELKKPESLRHKIRNNNSAPSIHYAGQSYREVNRMATVSIRPVKQNILTYPKNKISKNSKKEYAYK